MSAKHLTTPDGPRGGHGQRQVLGDTKALRVLHTHLHDQYRWQHKHRRRGKARRT